MMLIRIIRTSIHEYISNSQEIMKFLYASASVCDGTVLLR